MGVTAKPGQGFPSMTKTLRAFDRARVKTTVNAVRRVLTSIRADAKTNIRARGVGRRIWGQKPSGLDKFVKRVRVKADPEGISTGLSVHGLPGLIETGGKTNSHKIGGYLHLANKAAGFFVSGRAKAGGRLSVTHPGGDVRKRTNVYDAIEHGQGRFATAIAEALGEAMDEATNAAA